MSAPRKFGAASALRSQAGSSMLEALVAILIFSIGVIALMGLQAVSIKNVADSKYRADASFLANQLVGQLWTDIPNRDLYVAATHAPRKEWDDVVKATLPNSNTTVAVAGTIATITIKWQAPGQDEHVYKTAANITD